MLPNNARTGSQQEASIDAVCNGRIPGEDVGTGREPAKALK